MSDNIDECLAQKKLNQARLHTKAPREKSMANKYLNYFVDKGFTYVDKFTVKGDIRGYRVNAAYNPMNGLPVMHIAFYSTENQRVAVEQVLKAKAYTRFKYNFDQFGLLLMFQDMTIGAWLKRIDEIIATIFDALEENQILGAKYCPVCGKELGENAAERKLNGVTIAIDNDCIATINKQIDEENASFDEQPNNYGLGTVGALIGGVAGLAVFIVLYLAGFIGALSAFVSMIVGEILYKKFGGKPNKMMVVILSATTVVFMLGGMFGTTLIECGKLAADAGANISNLEAFKIIMNNADGQKWFWSNMLMTTLFTLFGIVWEIVRLVQSIKRPNKV